MIQFKVKNRWSGKVQFTAEIDCAADASLSVKLGLAVRWAIKAGADLTGADLTRAYLADADLTGADLTRAYLARAYLAGADLTRAYLAGADLTGAYLTDTLKVTPEDIPIVPKIDAAILSAIEAGGVLDMNSWHGHDNHWCGTTHCRAGWAIHLAGEKGKALEDRFSPEIAGRLIYEASRPGQPAPWFYAPTETALADIRKCAAEQTSGT